MKLLKLEQRSTTKVFWLIAATLLAVLVATAKQQDVAVNAMGVTLVVVSLVPLYLWMLGWSHGLPLWPVFAMVNGISFALPMTQDSKSLADYGATEILVGGATMAGFIFLATIVWVSMTSRAPRAPRKVLMIEQSHAIQYLLLFVGLGVLFQLNQMFGWIEFPGNTMPVARGVSASLNTMGLFVLAYYRGRGLLDRREWALCVAGAAATILMGLTSLRLAEIIVPVALSVLGYVLGSDRLPWRVLLGLFVLVALLHPGKYEMRNEYWNEDSPQLTLTGIPDFYAKWLGYGLEELGGLSGVVAVAPKDEDAPSSLFERSGSLHMLLLVQKKSPREVPYLNGMTYEIIPRLLVPRFLNDEKGLSHEGNVMLTVNYGLQTLEQTQFTSIGWGLVPEAYANFSYLGVAGLAVVLAVFYALMTRLTAGVPMTSLRFVLGLLIMAAATKADTMAVFVTMQFQAVVGVSLAAAVLMKRQANPFASTGGQRATGKWQEVSVRKKRLGEKRAPEGRYGAGDQESQLGALRTRLARAANEGRPLPRWASFRQRAIAMEIEKLERQFKAANGDSAESPQGAAAGQPPATRRPQQFGTPVGWYFEGLDGGEGESAEMLGD